MGYTHSEIGHNWAHQLKSHQGDRHFSFDGRKIKSYTTVIGEIVYTKNNTPVYFLNTGSYSTSTRQHQSHAFNAIPVDAIQFSASCGNFMYGWQGITNWEDELTDRRAKKFVVRNLQHIVDSLLEFKSSKALRIEKEFSLHYFDEALRFLYHFPLTSISKILRMTNDELESWFNIPNPTVFRKVVKSIMAENTELKSLVDIANGDGTYDDYYQRTINLRMTEISRKFNHVCGFKTVGFKERWYEPYPYQYGKSNGSRLPKNHTYISYPLSSCDSKGFTGREIIQHRENGDLIVTLHKAKKANFLKACEESAQYKRRHRVEEAKHRLEIFIGLRGWNDTWCNHYKRPFASFNYNGVEYTFNHWNHEQILTDEEYASFGKMSSEEQKIFIRNKRAEMLALLRYQDYQFEHQQEFAEQARIQREKEQAEKREYIERLKAQGDDGLRQLWHEGLITSSSLWGQPVTLFYGGNVLLRVANNGHEVVTSKGITISLNECKRLWTIINRWHESNTKFCHSGETVHAINSQKWNIQRYQNDIMIAGCHAIAYKEMVTIAKQLNF